jgi:hypothetical protein
MLTKKFKEIVQVLNKFDKLILQRFQQYNIEGSLKDSVN